jgi:hypothetical protein
MTGEIHRKRREIQELLDCMVRISACLQVNGYKTTVDKVKDEIEIGFFRKKPLTSYQQHLFESEYYLSFLEARISILTMIQDLVEYSLS